MFYYKKLYGYFSGTKKSDRKNVLAVLHVTTVTRLAIYRAGFHHKRRLPWEACSCNAAEGLGSETHGLKQTRFVTAQSFILDSSYTISLPYSLLELRSSRRRSDPRQQYLSRNPNFATLICQSTLTSGNQIQYGGCGGRFQHKKGNASGEMRVTFSFFFFFSVV